MSEPRTSDQPARQYIIIVSYPDGSGIHGAYGPYLSEATAKKAIPLLQALPGMDPGNDWKVNQLWRLPVFANEGSA